MTSSYGFVLLLLFGELGLVLEGKNQFRRWGCLIMATKQGKQDASRYFQKPKIRQEAHDACIEYAMILSLVGAMTVSQRREFYYNISSIEKLTTKQLKSFTSQILHNVSESREKYGIKATRKELLFLWKSAEALKDTVMLIPKYSMRELLSIPIPDAFENLPEHARISVDVGLYREVPFSGVEIFVPEAILFENMCALYNTTLEHKNRWNKEDPKSKKLRKMAEALGRATLVTAFNFVEAYLNGIAVDYYIKNHDKLDPQTIQRLTEWDSVKKQYRYISFRDKLIGYPRIASGAKYPPLDENSCPEMAYLLEHSKSMRDAIVHPAASPDITHYDPAKETKLFKFSFDEVALVIDNAIALVRKIETTIFGNCNRLFWISDRNQEGFSDDVFN